MKFYHTLIFFIFSFSLYGTTSSSNHIYISHGIFGKYYTLDQAFGICLMLDRQTWVHKKIINKLKKYAKKANLANALTYAYDNINKKHKEKIFLMSLCGLPAAGVGYLIFDAWTDPKVDLSSKLLLCGGEAFLITLMYILHSNKPCQKLATKTLQRLHTIDPDIFSTEGLTPTSPIWLKFKKYLVKNPNLIEKTEKLMKPHE